MKRSIFAILTAATLQIIPISASAIGMDELFSHVTKTHPLFRGQNLRTEAERKVLEGKAGDEDWTLSATPSLSGMENTRKQAFVPETLERYGIKATAHRHFWNTGGRLSVSYNTTYTDQVVPDLVMPMGDTLVTIPGDTGSYYENSVSATYIHPLMKNRDGRLSRLSYQLQEEEIKATELLVSEEKENFLLIIGDLFLDLALLEEQRKISVKRLDLANKELERTQKKRRQNMVDEVDVFRAKDAVLAGEQGVMRIKAGLAAKRAELETRAMISADDVRNTDYDIYSFPDLAPIDEARRELNDVSRVLKTFDVRLAQNDIYLAGSKNQEEPDLDLVVKSELGSAAEEYGDSHGYDSLNYVALLNFSYPLGNRSANAENAKAQIERDRITEEKANTILKLESALNNVWTQINELKKVLDIDTKRIKTAKAKTVAEMKRYKQGRSELSFVIQSRDGEQRAALIRAQNAALYQKLTLRYRALLDKLYTPGGEG